MKKFFMLAAGCAFLFACNNPSATETANADTTKTMVTTDNTPRPVEFADMKYVDIGKSAIAAMTSADMVTWTNMFSEKAVYRWSAGDSLAGKAAISKYWTDRRTKTVDSISFVNDIWLPIKVNQSQKGPDAPGIWLMSWYQVNVKYKNGQKLSFWVHTDFHFDSNDKIDQAIQYIDRAPINAALAKK